MSYKFKDSDLEQLARITFNSADKNIYNLQLQQLYEQRKSMHPNSFCKYGSKVFSQSDEDGITFEICRRLGIHNGFFIEFGVDDGKENNTLSLLANKWSGFWFGGLDLAIDVNKSKRLKFKKIWITRDNILGLAKEALSNFSKTEVDLISLDLDGNDFYLVSELLKNKINPKIFIVEYNGKFMPPIQFKIDYDEKHQWKSDDYYGASITSFYDLFNKNDYKLICCNAATGANAFFVRNEFATEFSDVPNDVKDIYVTPNFNLLNYWGHKVSTRTLEKIILE